MKDEYSKLGKSLFLFYTWRLIAVSIVFFAAFGYVNDYYTYLYHAFPDDEVDQPFKNMVNVLTISSQTARSIYSTCQLVISEGNTTANTGYYCQTNQSSTDCLTFLMNSLDNQLIYNTYGIYTSFRC